MKAFCPVSFALKLAGIGLLVGVVIGIWLSAAVVSSSDSSPGSQPDRAPATRVADVLPGQP